MKRQTTKKIKAILVLVWIGTIVTAAVLWLDIPSAVATYWSGLPGNIQLSIIIGTLATIGTITIANTYQQWRNIKLERELWSTESEKGKSSLIKGSGSAPTNILLHKKGKADTNLTSEAKNFVKNCLKVALLAPEDSVTEKGNFQTKTSHLVFGVPVEPAQETFEAAKNQRRYEEAQVRQSVEPKVENQSAAVDITFIGKGFTGLSTVSEYPWFPNAPSDSELSMFAIVGDNEQNSENQEKDEGGF